MTEEEIRKILRKIEAGRQFRRNDLNPEIRALDTSAGTDEMILEGYATTFDQEYELYSYDDWNGYRVTVYEKVARNAFDKTDMSDVIFLFDHRGRVMARTRNKTLIVKPDDFGLLSRANVSGSDLGPGLYKDVKGGYVDRMSMQFTVKKSSLAQVQDDQEKTLKVVRTIEEIGKLYDVSAVGIPANDGTDISARSAADGVIAELEAERLKAQIRAKEIAALKLSIDLSLERVKK